MMLTGHFPDQIPGKHARRKTKCGMQQKRSETRAGQWLRMSSSVRSGSIAISWPPVVLMLIRSGVMIPQPCDSNSRVLFTDSWYTAGYGLRDTFDTLMTKFETAKLRTLAEMVQYHRTHADICLPPGLSYLASVHP